MSFVLAAAVLSLGLAAFAGWRSRRPGGYYDREIYAMEPATHRRAAAIGLAFSAFFVFAYVLRLEEAGLAALALYALFAVFYVTSFLRGAADADE